ncbi:MAG: fructose-bisphosphate aldolase, partial [Deltaproteobacteria bacterium]|nr:fructose-bisphosphate aldolase [Deltaproteobacteria bacterium]
GLPMQTGRALRLKRIFKKDGKAVIVAVDHALIAGNMPPLAKPAQLISALVKGGADALLLTRGMIRHGLPAFSRQCGVIYRISGGFTLLTDPAAFKERIISAPEEALRLGADGVAVTIKFGHELEGQFMEQASRVADSCAAWGLPLLIEVMVRGAMVEKWGQLEALKIAARGAVELGADLVKIQYQGPSEKFAELIELCPVPVVVLGGEKAPVKEVFELVRGALAAGAAGVAMGRNIWGHTDVPRMTRTLAGLVHNRWSEEKALEYLEQ